MMRRVVRVSVLVALLVSLSGATSQAAGGGGGGSGSAPGPGPSSQGSAALTHGKLVAGAGGTYLPVPPSDIVPSGRDPRNPLAVPPQGANPQGMSCPNTSVFHVGPGSPAPGGVVAVISIHPAFTRNTAGGYDGSEPRFGYALTDAIPPGGDPAAVAPGSIATAANVAGHVVAVTAFLSTRGTWEDAQPVAPYGGTCVGATFTFSPPYLAGNAAPPIPPGSVLQTPPFPTGPDLVASLTGSWTIGGVDTLPGPGATARTFVHIPTCAWTDSDVPAQVTPFHALSATVVDGSTLFLLYEVTITPGAVTWNWGDGTSSTEAGPIEHGPSDLPSYDPSTQTWTDPCEVSHAYASVSGGRTVTASETFSIAITVSWSDGVAVHTQPVTCDPNTGGECLLPIGAGDGWTSGPHPVDQIEPVPFAPPSPRT